ncbi:MAG: hypothetical protein AMS19_07100 [Gemmatimonas sp. SG8_23]|nr:MAG: hypothetical protein AMS19_07100 [Gemmatimonas sp. SG8_23]
MRLDTVLARPGEVLVALAFHGHDDLFGPVPAADLLLLDHERGLAVRRDDRLGGHLRRDVDRHARVVTPQARPEQSQADRSTHRHRGQRAEIGA